MEGVRGTVEQSYLGQLIIYMLDVIIFTLYLLVICRSYPRRASFLLRLLAVVAIEAALCIPLALVRDQWDTLPSRVLVELLFSGVQFAAVPLLYRGSFWEDLLRFSGVLMTKNFSGNTYQLIQNLIGIDDTQTISFFSRGVTVWDWIVYAGVHLALLILITRLFERGEKARNIRLTSITVIELAAVTLFLRSVAQPYIRFIQPESGEAIICIRALMLIIYLMLIAIRAGLLSRKKAETDLEVNEGLLRAERKRYSEMRDTIELVNMRLHDLRRHLDKLQGRLTEEEIRSISEAMELYDGAIRTGSEIVDTVLCQKKLICDRNGIHLSYFCDGAAVRFMEPSSLYSLIDNALENAIEAVTGLEADKRLISFSISNHNGSVRIEVSNYFDPSKSAENSTSKPDKQRHGYGLKSMRYIAESCGGKAETETAGDMFFLTITLPNP